MAAIERTGIGKKVYLTASRANRFARIRQILEEQGVELPPRPEPSPEWIKRTQDQEARITTVVDVRPYVDRKLNALRTHASQVQDSFWSKLPAEALAEVFEQESFIRVHDETGAALPEDDMFAGLR
jgi:LmbE family N-acetylglucosaminyl deacetylase